MRPPSVLVPLVTIAVGLAVSGCGNRHGGGNYGCTKQTGSVCTIDTAHAKTVKIDDLGTSVAVSGLTAGFVHVQLNGGMQATIPQGGQSHLDGFLVTARAATATHATVDVAR